MSSKLLYYGHRYEPQKHQYLITVSGFLQILSFSSWYDQLVIEINIQSILIVTFS